MYGANLSYSLLTKYLEEIINLKLVVINGTDKSFELTEKGKEYLKHYGEYSVLRDKYASKQIDVVGHTDTDPIKKSNWKDNWELSAQRALSVLRYLEKKGISPEKIQATGRGQSQPIASNSNASGKARNRRVEIVVHMR